MGEYENCKERKFCELGKLEGCKMNDVFDIL